MKIKATLHRTWTPRSRCGWCLYLLTALLFLGACSGEKQGFVLSGKFKGLEQGEFICFSSAPEWGTLDTVRIENGKFNLQHALTDTVVLTLQYPNFMQTQIIAIPGREARISGNANNLLAIEVGSDEHNKLLNKFRKSVAALKTGERTAVAEQFIKENADSWAAIAVFQKYFLQAEKPDYAKMAKLLDEMVKNAPHRRALLVLKAQMRALLAARVGGTLPQFKATTLKGEKISNKSFKNKPLLITFWSTMASEFSYPLTRQRQLMQRLSNKVEQLNICLDVDTTACRRKLQKDTIGGYNVCDLRSFDSPLVAAFGLARLPANILVDSIGKIRERDIPVDSLEAVLRRHGIK